MPYNAAKGYYEDDYAGQTDQERTQAAINYYKSNNMQSQLSNAINYQNQKGYNQSSTPTASTVSETPKAQTGTFTNTNTNAVNNTQPTTQTVQTNMATPSNSYYIPYEQSIKDLIASYPSYTKKTNAEMEAEAQNYASLQINPQKTALQTALQNAITSANNQKTSINANYSTVQQTADRLLAEAQDSGTKSAIARGGGRSGAVEYEVGKLKQPIMTQVTQAENEKAAALTNVDNSLATVQSNYSTTLQELEAQRGTLVAQQLAAIKALDYANQTGSADRILAATQHLAEITNARNEFDNSLLNNYANLMGEMPATGTTASSTPTITSPIPNQPATSTPILASGGEVGLRKYVEDLGGTVGWDANTGEVTINGRKYTPLQLAQAGARLENDRWYVPESVLRSMLA